MNDGTYAWEPRTQDSLETTYLETTTAVAFMLTFRYQANPARDVPKPSNETAIKPGALMLTLPSEDGSILVFRVASLNFRHSLFLMGETG
jgi:hypothetical protein